MSLPSLHGFAHVCWYGSKGHPGGTAGQSAVRPFFPFVDFSDSSVLSLPVSELGTVVYVDWEGKASWSLACGVLLLRSWIIGG